MNSSMRQKDAPSIKDRCDVSHCNSVGSDGENTLPVTSRRLSKHRLYFHPDLPFLNFDLVLADCRRTINE